MKFKQIPISDALKKTFQKQRLNYYVIFFNLKEQNLQAIFLKLPQAFG